MKDIVTFETAVRLKEAGFPQPTPEAGQWWYNPNGILFVVYLAHETVELHEMGRRNTSVGHYWEDWTFAPTATDILRETPEYFLWKYKTKDMWGLSLSVWYDYVQKSNPAEAAAEAWLKLNTKK